MRAPQRTAPSRRSRRLVVLQSVREPRRTTNPYIHQLFASLPSEVSVRGFRWRTALWGRVDVFHVHWPEVVIVRREAGKALLRSLLFILVLLRMRVSRIAIVRTAHNLAPHERPVGRAVRVALFLLDRWTTVWICLNEFTPVPRGATKRVILHGDYVEWFEDYPRRNTVPGSLLFFGLLRPYKGLEPLLEEFAALDLPGITLRVAGKPESPDIVRLVSSAASSDPRISAELAYVDDERLNRIIQESQLVVLPYRNMHNSGAMLLALSLGRPVLVPENQVTRSVAEEMGTGWVHTFAGDISSAAMGRALSSAESLPPGGHPDLSRRRWTDIGAQHAAVYREAVELVRHRRGRRQTRSYSE